MNIVKEVENPSLSMCTLQWADFRGIL